MINNIYFLISVLVGYSIFIYIIYKLHKIVSIQKETINDYKIIVDNQKITINNYISSLKNEKHLRDNGIIYVHNNEGLPNFNDIINKLLGENWLPSNLKSSDNNDIFEMDNGDNQKINLDLDTILQKIHDNGLDSLTEEERNFLKNIK